MATIRAAARPVLPLPSNGDDTCNLNNGHCNLDDSFTHRRRRRQRQRRRRTVIISKSKWTMAVLGVATTAVLVFNVHWSSHRNVDIIADDPISRRGLTPSSTMMTMMVSATSRRVDEEQPDRALDSNLNDNTTAPVPVHSDPNNIQYTKERNTQKEILLVHGSTSAGVSVQNESSSSSMLEEAKRISSLPNTSTTTTTTPPPQKSSVPPMLLIHIGPSKTGTTTLQEGSNHLTDVLAQDHVVYAGKLATTGWTRRFDTFRKCLNAGYDDWAIRQQRQQQQQQADDTMTAFYASGDACWREHIMAAAFLHMEDSHNNVNVTSNNNLNLPSIILSNEGYSYKGRPLGRFSVLCQSWISCSHRCYVPSICRLVVILSQGTQQTY